MVSSMEVGGATDVAVDYRRPVRGGYGPLAIAVGLQDRTDRGVGARTDLERPGAGGLEPFAAVALGQPQDAHAGAEALLGMRSLAHDDLDQGRRVAPDLGGLPLDALRRPVGIALVARRHVLAHCRVLAVGGGTHMGGDAPAAMEQLDRARRDARPQFLAQQLMR